MAVAIRVQCDAAGCERHFNVALPQGASEVVDLSVGAAGMWLEVLLNPPPAWRFLGTLEDFTAWCGDHASRAADS